MPFSIGLDPYGFWETLGHVLSQSPVRPRLALHLESPEAQKVPPGFLSAFLDVTNIELINCDLAHLVPQLLRHLSSPSLGSHSGEGVGYPCPQLTDLSLCSWNTDATTMSSQTLQFMRDRYLDTSVTPLKSLRIPFSDHLIRNDPIMQGIGVYSKE
jgi:hypothetical protein